MSLFDKNIFCVDTSSDHEVGPDMGQYLTTSTGRLETPGNQEKMTTDLSDSLELPFPSSIEFSEGSQEHEKSNDRDSDAGKGSSAECSSSSSSSVESLSIKTDSGLGESLENSNDSFSSLNSLRQLGSDINIKNEKDRMKRFEYLLKQTEIFAHFMKEKSNSSQTDASNSSPNESRPKRRRKQNKSPEFVYDASLRRKSEEKETEVKRETQEVTNDEKKYDLTPNFIANGTMRDYQVRGLNWLISLYDNGINGILADEMGLGKTLQTIAFLGYLKNQRKNSGPHLIIAPKSTLSNWMNELAFWCPSLKAICLIGLKHERAEFIKNVYKPGDWDVVVTSYEMILLEKRNFKKFNWKYIVVDEAHRIKNEMSKLSEVLRELTSANRLLLTGTPLQNNLHELWALLNFILPDVFHSSSDFDSWFNTNQCLGNTTIIERLHSILKPFLLRRVKSDVEKSLLPKIETKVFVRLTPMQREWYRNLLLKDIEIIRKFDQKNKVKMLNILMQLRKICNHPYLFNGAEPGPPYSSELLVKNSGKMLTLDKLLPKLKREGSRVLLFSQMTAQLDILQDYLTWRKYKFFRLDGNTAHPDREQYIREFNAEGSPIFIFLISTRAGGLGINLATADVVIIYDSDWNPQMDIQAIDRCHRIGQKKQVQVFRFVTQDSIEEKIVEKAEVKLKLDKMVIQRGRLNDTPKVANEQDLFNIIRFGADKLLDTSLNSNDEDIETILTRSSKRTRDLQSTNSPTPSSSNGLSKIEDLQLETPNSSPSASPPGSISVYNFEGKDYRLLQAKRKRSSEQKDFNLILDLSRSDRFKGRKSGEGTTSGSFFCSDIKTSWTKDGRGRKRKISQNADVEGPSLGFDACHLPK